MLYFKFHDIKLILQKQVGANPSSSWISYDGAPRPPPSDGPPLLASPLSSPSGPMSPRPTHYSPFFAAIWSASPPASSSTPSYSYVPPPLSLFLPTLSRVSTGSATAHAPISGILSDIGLPLSAESRNSCQVSQNSCWDFDFLSIWSWGLSIQRLWCGGDLFSHGRGKSFYGRSRNFCIWITRLGGFSRWFWRSWSAFNS